jgi:phosphopantothenoylcysteine decarboxylase/phosphopantothenate--cysteine ligase
MAEPIEILAAARDKLGPRLLAGERVLVTAGPTHEAIDPVRFIGNRSTGKMGFAIAADAVALGAEVTLIAGPTALSTPAGVSRVDIVSAAELRDAVMARADQATMIVMAAAVADERPPAVSAQKLKKTGAASSIELTPTVDVLAELGSRNYAGARPLLVGFAAETEKLVEHAQAKLGKKRCDLLVANDVSQVDAGFAVDTNRVTLFRKDAPPEPLPLLDKRAVARRILEAMKGMRR